MKIALISDIHGNLPALEAALDDIYKRRADKIICLGDIVGKGPSTKETIDLCRTSCDIVIMGNWEDGLCKSSIARERGETDIHPIFTWSIDDAGEKRMEYLQSLPHSTEMHLSGKLIRMFHAHPMNFNRYFSDSPIEQLLELFGKSESSTEQRESDIAVYADIHTAYMQTLRDKMLINTGSVGNPLDITQASYVIIEGSESDETATINVQFIRVKYDIDRAIAIAKAKNVPFLDGYISELTTARYFNRSREEMKNEK
jgi:Predicted phosphoesterase